jgi:hypothetical protein
MPAICESCCREAFDFPNIADDATDGTATGLIFPFVNFIIAQEDVIELPPLSLDRKVYSVSDIQAPAPANGVCDMFVLQAWD